MPFGKRAAPLLGLGGRGLHVRPLLFAELLASCESRHIHNAPVQLQEAFFGPMQRYCWPACCVFLHEVFLEFLRSRRRQRFAVSACIIVALLNAPLYLFEFIACHVYPERQCAVVFFRFCGDRESPGDFVLS